MKPPIEASRGYGDMRLLSPAHAAAVEPEARQWREAGFVEPPVVEVDAVAAIESGFKNHGYRQGTRECVAFYRGACWQLQSALGVAPSPAPQPLPFDPGYVYAYLKAALLSVEPDGLTDPQAAYFLEWFEAIGNADGVALPDGSQR